MSYQYQTRPLAAKKKKKRPPKKVLLVLLIVVGAAVAMTALELTNTTHLFHKEKPAITAGPETKGEPKATNSKEEAGSAKTGSGTSTNNPTPQNSQPGDNKSTDSGGGSSASLVAPSGNFVSSHKVSPDTTLQSVCNTTPGATCEIIFTNNGETKSLKPQITDRGGATYWTWKAQKDAGLYAGTWQIQAKASLNGQTMTAKDVLPLEVTP